MAETAPLLESAPIGGVVNGGDDAEGSWWKRSILDMEETKEQVLFSLPMILTNLFYYAITMVSVMFAGHLGKLELAGATLANSWASITGIALVTGSSGALETLCGQGFGAKQYRMLGVYLQSSCIISIIISIVISVVWLYTEPILILFQQDPSISKTGALYVRYLIPGLFAYGFVQNIIRFLQTQSVVIPLVFLSVIPMALHFVIVNALVYWTNLGFIGAPMAASISLWISALLLGLYVLFSKRFKETWGGFSFESFSCLLTTLKLALPSAAMVCLEFGAFEILVMFAGMMPDGELTTSLIAMSTRVSNELGAGNLGRAKNSMAVTIKLSLLLALIVDLALGFGHSVWAGFFSDDPEIIKAFAGLAPYLVISITFDSVQCSLQGVTRGCGWQHLAVYANLATFYLIGTPIAALLGFKLHLYAKGLWIGLICGIFTQALTLLSITLCSNWNKLDIYVKKGKETQV